MKPFRGESVPASRVAPGPAAIAPARVWRNFWILVAATVVAVGTVSRAVESPASPLTGVAVAVAGLAGVVSFTLAARILVVATTGWHLVRRR